MPAGSLTVIGTGIRMLSQLTPEARHAIETADLVLHDGDAATRQALRAWNPHTRPLDDVCEPDQPRKVTYLKTVARMMEEVRRGSRLCAAFYGHPGVFVFASHEAIRQCRREGLPARMLPGISAEDCLYADLGVDPGIRGCQCFEVTEFLIRQIAFDAASPLVLWQIGLVGSLGYDPAPNLAARRTLMDALAACYGWEHPVTLYQASQFPVCPPLRSSFPLRALEAADISPFATLYVPPARRAEPDPEMARRLGIPLAQLGSSGPGGRS
jgi:hypothetical protein